MADCNRCNDRCGTDFREAVCVHTDKIYDSCRDRHLARYKKQLTYNYYSYYDTFLHILQGVIKKIFFDRPPHIDKDMILRYNKGKKGAYRFKGGLSVGF